ncbi:PREDICTED: LOB domain-containing protein 11-like isoform X2 [Tarenaya hassleriana]|uniref:LOB domain-containing protein 11-like isoform X2 n=1 Tax=Tarenaya hassleriana TaxID=28532 RepID=UPI00053C8F80|nr:PREDICTED: LOB domain-containing protein 11-like isoform X2 [Tarenaya hassleriana]
MLKMEINGDTATPSPPSNISSPPFPASPQSQSQTQVVMSPCAACKILRRRCAEKCVLAPYFPPTEPTKFTIAHRVFGASNIIKFLQDLPESQRADAVNSMVYEAGARIRDPVYGSAGAIYHLQRQVSELQAQLAKAQVELVSVQLQRANLLALLCNQPNVQDQLGPYNHLSSSFESGDDFISSPDEESNDLGYFLDDNTNSSMSWWDHPLLT